MIELNDIKSLNSWLDGKHSVFVVGAGEFGKIIGEYVNKFGHSLSGYVDRRGSGDVDGISIFPYSFKFPSDVSFLISSFDYGLEMAAELSANGIDEIFVAGIMNRQIVLDAYEYVYHYRQYTAKLDTYEELGKYESWIGDDKAGLFDVTLPEDSLLTPKIKFETGLIRQELSSELIVTVSRALR